MQAIFGKNFKGGIKLRSYCRDHSPTADLNNGDQTDIIDANSIKEIDMTNQADDRLQERNEELDYFWKYVDINEVLKKILEMHTRHTTKVKKERIDDAIESHDDTTPKKKKENKLASNMKKTNALTKSGSPKKVKIKASESESDTSTSLDEATANEADPLVIDLIYRYWMLLRTANNGQSLIKFSPTALKEREFEQRKSIMKLRIELERVRNLSYMISKREKLKSSWLKIHQNIIKRTFNIINDLKPVPEQLSIDFSSASGSPSQIDHNQIASNHNHHTHIPTGKKSLHQTQHVQPTNGMFDESDQLINDLISCDQIYELPNSSSNSNLNNLSHQERSTLERRRTLSLVRRINRQLKNVPIESTLNPYKKSYLVTASKRSDSPVGLDQQQPATKMIKYR